MVYIYISRFINYKTIITGVYIVTIISGILLITIGTTSPIAFCLSLIPASLCGNILGPPRTNLMIEQVEGDIGSASSLIGCDRCKNNNNLCIFNDDLVNEIIEKAKYSDGFIFGSPVYFASANGALTSLLDRVFYAGSEVFAYKPAASVVSAWRAGTTAAYDQLNKSIEEKRIYTGFIR